MRSRIQAHFANIVGTFRAMGGNEDPTGPSNPSSRKVAEAVAPVLPPPTITIGFVPVPANMRY
jgi:hypothetical protein